MEASDAPGLSWVGTRAYWKCPKRFTKEGYQFTNARLPGHKGDGEDAHRAHLCRTYQAEAEAWWDSEAAERVTAGTWQHVFGRYRDDEFSPLAEVKPNTRASYLEQIAYWETAIGHTRIEDMDYEEIRNIIGAMRKRGRSDSFIHRKFTMLRIMCSYGAALKIPGVRDVKEVLAELSFPKGSARQIAPTRAQVEAVVDAADAKGLHAFAAGLLLQYEFALRAVDVRGQFLPGGEGGIRRKNSYWADGLTWQMFDADLTHFEKVISKTTRSLPEPYIFQLQHLPNLRARLQLLRGDRRFGPVIVASDGLPYTRSGWAQAWHRLRTDAGVPETVWLMDMRAGALSEAKGLGADAWSLRDAGQHASVTTTDKYARGRSESANKVVQLRSKR